MTTRYQIPLSDLIESKFGGFYAHFKISEGRYYLYKYIESNEHYARYNPESFLMYDE